MSHSSRVRLIPLEKRVSLDDVLALAPHDEIIACDFAIEGAEHFKARPWGYESGRVINIDHHTPTSRMQRRISSTNLAIRYVRARGVVPESATVVINHTDCDSVLASAILSGQLQPEPRFGQAAIAADHSGRANVIADLLQALNLKRDYEFSLHNLRALLDKRPLDAEAQQALTQRLADRQMAKDVVASGAFEHCGSVYYATLNSSVDGELFPALLPQAQVIVLFIPHPENPASRFVKVRLGLAAPEGLSLHDLSIEDFDPTYGGRWNAGSNKRGKDGTLLSPEIYTEHLMKVMSVTCEES